MSKTFVQQTTKIKFFDLIVAKIITKCHPPCTPHVDQNDWHSSETRTCLAPICGLASIQDSHCKWVEFVSSLPSSKRFFLGIVRFSLSPNTNISFDLNWFNYFICSIPDI